MLGRTPAPPVNLPDVAHEASYVADWLQQHEGSARRPDATARLLTLAVKLSRKRQPWPTRDQLAAHLQMSKPMIDVVVSQRQATGHLAVEISTMPGNIRRRQSTITLRYLKPSPELTAVVAKAERARKKIERAAAERHAPAERRRRPAGKTAPLRGPS